MRHEVRLRYGIDVVSDRLFVVGQGDIVLSSLVVVAGDSFSPIIASVSVTGTGTGTVTVTATASGLGVVGLLVSG